MTRDNVLVVGFCCFCLLRMETKKLKGDKSKNQPQYPTNAYSLPSTIQCSTFQVFREKKDRVRLFFISDTHGHEKELSLMLEKHTLTNDANVLLHCGDWTHLGDESTHTNFVQWFGSLKNFKYKFIVRGNHEQCKDFMNGKGSHNELQKTFNTLKNTIYLEYHTYVIKEFGYLTITGISFFSFFLTVSLFCVPIFFFLIMNYMYSY